MHKETLSLKSKSTVDLTSLPTLALEAAQATFGRKGNYPLLKASKSATKLIETAISNKSYVFIQLRQGAGYRGLPTKLDGAWLTLEDANIFGTKKSMHVTELLIQVKDGSYIAPLHTSESQGQFQHLDDALEVLK